MRQTADRRAYENGKIVAGDTSSRCVTQRAEAAAAHEVAAAAAHHAAHEPLRSALAVGKTVTNPAHDTLLRLCAAITGNQGQERVSLWALRGVVHVLGAHAAVLVQPLCGEVDGGGVDLERAFMTHVEVACAASGADALVLNECVANGTLAVRILIGVGAAGVTGAALHDGSSGNGGRPASYRLVLLGRHDTRLHGGNGDRSGGSNSSWWLGHNEK